MLKDIFPQFHPILNGFQYRKKIPELFRGENVGRHLSKCIFKNEANFCPGLRRNAMGNSYLYICRHTFPNTLETSGNDLSLFAMENIEVYMKKRYLT